MKKMETLKEYSARMSAKLPKWLKVLISLSTTFVTLSLLSWSLVPTKFWVIDYLINGISFVLVIVMLLAIVIWGVFRKK